MRGNVAVLCGFCPNTHCRKRLYFPENEASVECFGCGQRHTPSVLINVERLTSNSDIVIGIVEALDRLLNARDKTEAVKKEDFNHESLKVDGMTNYLCTILSPLLTSYGMDKTSGRAKLLTEMGKPPVFDCGQLCDRAFLIDPAHLNVPSYGRDRSGSRAYLQDTLDQIKLSNEKEERLVPVHADGDGHCLVHAVSRALIGWELFWHPLRMNLKHHLINNLQKYKMQFKDFVDESEWALIINECDPDFVPSGLEPTGLRNIHIFGLANVLRRPIVLLDCLEGIRSSGDYSAIFLPYFSPPSACMNKEGKLNSPLCIAWSSMGRNHFIPLVGIKGKKCPLLSRYMIQRSWGVSDIEIDMYVHFDDMGRCQIGGEKILQSSYIQRLVSAMSNVFYELHSVSPALLSDVQEQIFKANGLVCGLNVGLLLDKARTSISQQLLFVCLDCRSLALAQQVSPDWCCPGGELYDLAVTCHGPQLKDGQNYSFPLHSQQKPMACLYCSGIEFRLVNADYSIQFKDGDRTFTKSNKCPGGFKHYWNGQEYDTMPKKILVLMEWGGKTVKSVVPWFQGEEDPSLNSNVYAMAQDLVQTHFPGEFGSERLVQKVVDQILRQTENPEPADKDQRGAVPQTAQNSAEEAMDASDSEGQSRLLRPGSSEASAATADMDLREWSPLRASKAILTGMQRKSVHREELNKSTAEKRVRSQIEANAPKQQQKLSSHRGPEEKRATPSIPQRTPEKQKSPSPSMSPGKVGNSQISQSNSSEKLTSKPSANKRIRLTLSDNRNMTLDLPAECKFLELQALVSTATLLPPNRLRIRHGFPPKELKPPASPCEDYRVPVQPGDRIMVDIVSVPARDGDASRRGSARVDRGKTLPSPAKKPDPPWMSLAEGGMDEVSDRVLQGLMDPLLNSGGDSLDHSLSALALTAALENRDLWTHVQRLPHLFSVNGAFYRQVERDIGLEHGRHYQVPLLPHKVFVYNSHADRLELCLEPYGHFPVEVNVERNSESMLPSGRCNKHKPFSGQGHVLKSNQEERMPTDVPMSPKRHEARRLNTLCDPSVHQESIEEEEEEEEEEETADSRKGGANSPSHRLSPADLVRHLPLSRGVGLNSSSRHSFHSGSQHFHPHQDSKLVRRGPGYSELSPIPENSGSATTPTEESSSGSSGSSAVAGLSISGGAGSGSGGIDPRSDMLHQWVSHIKQAMEMMGSEAQAIGEGRQPTFPAQQQLQSFSFPEHGNSRALGSEHDSGGGVNDPVTTDISMRDSQTPVSDVGALSSHSPSFNSPMQAPKSDCTEDSRGNATSIETFSSRNESKPEPFPLSPSKRRQLPATPTVPPVVFTSSMSSTGVSPASSSSSASSSARTSPERKSGRGSGMRNSGGSCKDALPSSLTPSPTSQAMVAALAGQVASDIAAMDTDTVPLPDNTTGDCTTVVSLNGGEESNGADEKMDTTGEGGGGTEEEIKTDGTQDSENEEVCGKEDMESP
ncbi:deubiquitinating protein VCIP135-like [Elysia marginata]|uniref:ubiquitinyl hydrolase 1 n=1 Tax=Elysia marginata TaxID=1093978 RepID=A0AAV4JU35_9GAST|nr:deubiquitinating protein VCIP135-like [Elysia marginata]